MMSPPAARTRYYQIPDYLSTDDMMDLPLRRGAGELSRPRRDKMARVPGPSCLSWVSITRPRRGEAEDPSYRQSTDNQESDNIWCEPPEDSSWTLVKPSSRWRPLPPSSWRGGVGCS